MINLDLIKQTTKQSKLTTKTLQLTITGLFIVASLILPTVVNANQYEQQISELNNTNRGLETQKQELQLQAASYQEAIDALKVQISDLQKQIAENQRKADALKLKIAEIEVEIEKQQDLLGKNIRAMYLEDDISTFEMLASSNDLSDFVDREQYRISVKDKITKTLETIESLRAELAAQQKQLQDVIENLRGMKQQLDAQKAEQSRLLSLNKQQRAKLDSEMRANSTKIDELRRQQAIENARLFGNGMQNVPDTTGYPWSNVQPFPNTYVDPWGMYKRQCVSYTAWKVWKSGRHMPYWGGHGNAKYWDDNARAAGIPVDGNPRVGDVAVSNSGTYGHVMYVEHVYGDGTIYVSQYNAGWDGRYSEARIPIGSLVFIHF